MWAIHCEIHPPLPLPLSDCDLNQTAGQSMDFEHCNHPIQCHRYLSSLDLATDAMKKVAAAAEEVGVDDEHDDVGDDDVDDCSDDDVDLIDELVAVIVAVQEWELETNSKMKCEEMLDGC